MKYDSSGFRREDGVALIFALAILALLLVMLVGFMATAILEQRIAYNQSSAVGSKLLARSALRRIEAMMGAYASDCAVNSYILQSDGSGITPMVSGALIADPGTVGWTQDAYSGYLSKLVPDYFTANRWWGTAVVPQWLPTFAGGRLTGRVAYMIFPNLGINPSHYTAGTQTVATAIKEYMRKSGSPATATTPLAALEFVNAATAAKLANQGDWVSTDLILGAEGANVGTGVAGVDMGDLRGNQRPELKDIYNLYFMPDYPPVESVEWSRGGLLNVDRFNLTTGATGPTGSGGWTMDTAVVLLSRFPDYSAASNPLHNMTPALEFHLKRFTSPQREQIIANLIDYSDADSIPSSDIKAATWTITSEPTYTGNEKTPYINEIALELPKVNVAFVAGSGLFAGYDVKLKATERMPTLVVELAGIYQDMPAGTYTFSTEIKRFQLKIEVQPKITVKYTYKDALAAVINEEFEYTPGDTGPALSPGCDIKNAVVSCTVNVPAGRGYAIGSAVLPESAEAGSDVRDYSGELETQYNAATMGARAAGGTDFTITAAEVTGLRYRIGGTADAEIEFSGMLLKDSTGGVDFVRMQEAGNMKVDKGSVATGTYSPYAAVNASHTYNVFSKYCYLGGIEAKDPRQNLYPDAKDDAKSDWDLKKPALTNGSGTGAPTMIFAADLSTATGTSPALSTRVTGGKVNTGANPANADPAKAMDWEIVTDPVAGLSTAILENRPMKRISELGRIHRGKPFQTLNLRKYTKPTASDSALPDGDEGYKKGDGILFDQVQLSAVLTDKFNDESSTVKQLRFNINTPAVHQEAFKLLTAQTAYPTDNAEPPAVTGLTLAQTGTLAQWLAEKRYDTGSYPRYASWGELASVISHWSQANGNVLPARDAEFEKFIESMMYLTRVGDNYEYYTVLIVAQAIKDIGGDGSTVPVHKYDADGNKLGDSPKNCRLGTYEEGYDEITDTTYLVARLRRRRVLCLGDISCVTGYHKNCQYHTSVIESYIVRK